MRLILSVIAACFLALPLSAVETGAKAPEFTLPGSDGQPHNLASYQDKYVVLEWINHDCPFVVKHYGSGNMQKVQSESAAKGAVWLSIASSVPGKQGALNADSAKAISAEKKSAANAVLIDADAAVAKAYGAKTTPHMFIIDPKGVIIYQGAIDSKASTEASDIASSINYISQALSEALAGKPVSVPETKAYGCSVKYE